MPLNLVIKRLHGFVLITALGLAICAPAAAETVSTEFSLSVGDSYVLASTKRNQMWYPRSLASSIIINSRERFEVTGKTPTGYRIKVTLLGMTTHWNSPQDGTALSAPRSAQQPKSGNDDLTPLFTAFIKHSTGASMSMLTDEKGIPLKLIGWREMCNEITTQLLADFPASSQNSIHELIRQVLGDSEAMTDKTAVRKLGMNYIIWAMHHNFKGDTGPFRPTRFHKSDPSRSSFFEFREDGFLAHSNNYYIHKNKIVITSLEQYGKDKWAASDTGNIQSGQSYYDGKNVRFSQQWRHEISRSTGMTTSAYLDRINVINQVSKEEAWTVTLEE